jgi:hypothetical protein
MPPSIALLEAVIDSATRNVSVRMPLRILAELVKGNGTGTSSIVV